MLAAPQGLPASHLEHRLTFTAFQLQITIAHCCHSPSFTPAVIGVQDALTFAEAAQKPLLLHALGSAILQYMNNGRVVCMCCCRAVAALLPPCQLPWPQGPYQPRELLMHSRMPICQGPLQSSQAPGPSSRRLIPCLATQHLALESFMVAELHYAQNAHGWSNPY